MHVLGVQVGLGVSLLCFTFLTNSYKVQDSISIGYAKQGSDLLVRGSPLPHTIPDVDPAGSEIILLYSKKNICRRDGPVLDPEFSLPLVRCFDHDNNHGIRAVDLRAAHLLAGSNFPDHILVTYHYKLHWFMAEGCRCSQCNLHDLADDLVVDMLTPVATNRAPLSGIVYSP